LLSPLLVAVLRVRAEAKRYRTQLRAAEAERDELRATIEGLQRSTVEAHLHGTGVKPEALWAVAKPADLLADDGTVDASLLHAAMQRARDTLGLAPPTAGFSPLEGRYPGPPRPSGGLDGMAAAIMRRT
jgi:hypothetical protein